MKLSEKLAAIEDQERSETALASSTTAATAKRQPRRDATSTTNANRSRRSGATRQASKRKVQDLVLAEVAPKMQGLYGEELVAEVRGSLDRILQREDVKVSPLERRRFVQEMIQDILGYG